MKRFVRGILSVVLAFTLVVAAASPAFAAIDSKKQLHFNEDGSFKIMQFADTQDGLFTRPAMVKFIEEVLDKEQPDLVVFTGDNITSSSFTAGLAKNAIDNIVKPINDRGIPFTITFGNHDGEGPITKGFQLWLYQKYEMCLAYDDACKVFGVGSHNLPILASGSDDIAFNLWIVDSNEYDENGDYDFVHQDQQDWYVQKSNALKAANGGKAVPSLWFQHIPVPEIYQLLKPVAQGTDGARTRHGGTWALELNPAMAEGTIGEWPCPPAVNSGQFATIKAQGDVLAMVFGHDHVNSFVGTVDGVDLVQTAGMSFQSYGAYAVRGCRIFELNESDPWSYKTRPVTHADVFGEDEYAQYVQDFLGSGWGEAVAVFELLVDILAGAVRLMTGRESPAKVAAAKTATTKMLYNLKTVVDFFGSLNA